ncbi:MAG: hypothetical protein IID45_05885 [Planctomycetes bacterium]|nr:hypothetical protein [Planctomycetota bacterium]
MLTLSFNHLLLAAAVKPGDPAGPGLFPVWAIFLLVVALIGIPFLAGNFLAKWLKMKDLSLKISTVLLAVTLGLAPFVSQYVIGAREQSRHEDRLEEWKEKDAYRKKISKTARDELENHLKKADPSAQVQPHTDDPSGL